MGLKGDLALSLFIELDLDKTFFGVFIITIILKLKNKISP